MAACRAVLFCALRAFQRSTEDPADYAARPAGAGLPIFRLRAARGIVLSGLRKPRRGVGLCGVADLYDPCGHETSRVRRFRRSRPLRKPAAANWDRLWSASLKPWEPLPARRGRQACRLSAGRGGLPRCSGPARSSPPLSASAPVSSARLHHSRPRSAFGRQSPL